MHIGWKVENEPGYLMINVSPSAYLRYSQLSQHRNATRPEEADNDGQYIGLSHPSHH